MPTKILLGDDHKIMRDGLRMLIQRQPGMEVVGEADNGQNAVAMVWKLVPDVVVLDIGMPELNGIEAARQITNSELKTKVIALSMHADRRYVREMLNAGASGYLVKDSAFDEVIRAIRAVADGYTYLSPIVTGLVIDECRRFSGTDSDGSPFNLLTEREREVLQKLSEGNSTKGIARSLHLSVKTIETHRIHLMDKLKLHSVAELTKYAIREGLTSLESKGSFPMPARKKYDMMMQP